MNNKNVATCLLSVVYIDFLVDFAYHLRKRFHFKRTEGIYEL